MMGLPNWLRGREGDFDMTQDEVPIPPVARIEPLKEGPRKGGINPPPANFIRPDAPPAFGVRFDPTKLNDDHAASVVVQAHSYIEQWKQERVAQQLTIEELRTALKSEQRKSGLLELEVAELQNTIATLQSEILSLKSERDKYRQFLSVKKQINEKERQAYIEFEIEDPPKKERKPNAKATKAPERQATSQPTSEDRPTTQKPDKV